MALDLFDPTIQKILALYPPPTPGTPLIDNATGYYFFPSSDRFTSDNFTAKIDHRINEKNTLTGRYNFVRYIDPNQTSANFLPPDIGSINTHQRTQGLSLAWTSTIRPTMVNDLRVGANRTNSTFDCTGTKLLDSFAPADPFGRGFDYGLSDEFGGGPSNFGCQTLGDTNGQAGYADLPNR